MNPLQRASIRRKSFYFAAILALFTLSIFYRGLEAREPDGSSHVWMPFGRDDRIVSPSAVNRAGDALSRQTILSQARRLELRELDEGDPEITGEAVRLGLLGSRGFVVTVLWYTAIEKQKRNDFHEFERLVKAVTTLQPHFIIPWIFQSWNIAYNVSVEMQSLGDMYFYIARGIDLLAEGERRNRRSPDMRYEIATYYQTKFGIADQVQTLRCLFQLSCMPPDERNPDALMSPDGSVDMERFKTFCEKHPMLVRRLRGEERQDAVRDSRASGEMLRTRDPLDVVSFLRENQLVPSRYKNATELKSADQQFPALPLQFNEGPDEAHPRSSATDLTEAFSGYLAARAWFKYSNAIAPPNPRDKEGNPIPTAVPADYDPFKYRVPRRPVLILFRQGAPRAQTYQAEMMQKDGWFDGEGWEVDGRSADVKNAWFVETVGGVTRTLKVVVGGGTPWSLKEWQASYRLWANHGVEYGLSLTPSQLSQYRQDAGVNDNDYVEPSAALSPEQRENAALVRRHDARNALNLYGANRGLTNFAFYLALCEGEQQKETVEARKILWKADQTRRLGVNIEAAKLYRAGFVLWREVLKKNPNFHRPDRLHKIEEDTCEYELDYLRLLAASDERVWVKAREDYAKEYAMIATAAIPFGAGSPLPKVIPDSMKNAMYAEAAERHFAVFAGNITAQDVPPGDPRIGGPWIQAQVRETILIQQGIIKAPTGPPLIQAGGAVPPPPPPPGGS